MVYSNLNKTKQANRDAQNSVSSLNIIVTSKINYLCVNHNNGCVDLYLYLYLYLYLRTLKAEGGECLERTVSMLFGIV